MRNFGCAFVCFLYVCLSLSLHTVKFLIFFFFSNLSDPFLFLLCACLSLSLFPNQKKIYLSLYPLTLSGWVRVLHRRLLAWSSRGKCSSFNPKTKQNKKNWRIENKKIWKFLFHIILLMLSYYLLVILDFSFLFDFFFAWSVVSLFFSPHFVSLFVRNHKHTRTLVPPLSLSLSLSLWQIVSSPNYYGLCFIVNFIYKHQKQLIRENYFLLFISFSAFRLLNYSFVARYRFLDTRGWLLFLKFDD